MHGGCLLDLSAWRCADSSQTVAGCFFSSWVREIALAEVCKIQFPCVLNPGCCFHVLFRGGLLPPSIGSLKLSAASELPIR